MVDRAFEIDLDLLILFLEIRGKPNPEFSHTLYPTISPKKCTIRPSFASSLVVSKEIHICLKIFLFEQ